MSEAHRNTRALSSCPSCGAVIQSRRFDGFCPACAWDLVVAPEEPALARQANPQANLLWAVPGHEILGEIARGGMGIVYRARQLDTNRMVALKMLLPYQMDSAEMRERFQFEAQVIAALDHPAVLPVYQVGEHENLPFYTMKYVGGGMLADRQGAYRGRFRAVAELMITLADAVQFAHQRGVLHRDLKPSNILFDEAGRAYVSDFGLAKLIGADHGLTRSVQFMGTPHYMAPEILERSPRFATTASDIYSLGAILYQLLTGRPPFEAEGIPALLRKIAEEEPRRITGPPRSGRWARRGIGLIRRLPDPVPRDLEVISLKCLAKEPSQRYASAHELAADLRRWMAGQPIWARAVPRSERLLKWSQRNPALAALISFLVLMLIGGAAALAWSNQRLQLALGGSYVTLQESLIVQARLERTSHRLGQPVRALGLIDRALALPLSPSRSDPARRLVLRAEIAGALALPNLRPLSRWPVPVSSPEGAIALTGDLSHYAASAPGGGFQVWQASEHRLARHFPGPATNPAVRFRFSRREGQPDAAGVSGLSSGASQWLAAFFQDGHAEVHALGGDRPPVNFAGCAFAPTEVAFVPETPFALVAAYQAGLVLHDLRNSSRRELIAPPETVTAVQVDPRGQRAACFLQRRVQVLRLEDGARLWWSASLPHRLASLSWSTDGRYLAMAKSIQPFEITVFDLDSVPVPTSEATYRGGLASPSSRVPEGYDCLPVLPPSASDTLSARIVAHFQDHELAVSRLAFHPDGAFLASVGQDQRLVLRQLSQTGLKLFGPAEGRVLQFSTDGQRLVYQPERGQVEVLKVEPSIVFHEWCRITPPDEEACRLAVGPQGRFVATSSARGIQFWDAAARAQIAHLPLPSRAKSVMVCFHPKDQALLYSAPGLGALRRDYRIWEAGPKGKLAVEFGAPRPLGEDAHRAIRRFCRERRSLAAGTPPGRPTVDSVSRDGRWIGTATPEGQIDIWSLLRALPVLSLPPPQPIHLRDLAFSPDRRRLYLWQSTGRLLEWDLAELRRELEKRGLAWEE